MQLKKIFSVCSICFLSLIAGFGFSESTFPRPSRVIRVEDIKPHVGLLFGVADPSGRGGVHGDFGLDIGYQPYIPFGVGLEVAGTRVQNVNQTRMLLHGTYNFGGDLPVLRSSYVGVGVGPVLGTVGDSNRVILGFAPIAGFDIGVWDLSGDRNDRLSLGLQARYLMTEGSDPDTGMINGTVKYWF